MRGTGAGSEAGNGTVVVVDKGVGIVDGNVDVADGGCVGVINDDMAASRGLLGCILRVCMAVLLVVGAVWVLTSTGAGAWSGPLHSPLKQCCGIVHSHGPP